MAVDLGSTFKELIDEINSKGSGAAIDSIDGLKGGILSSPLIVSGGNGVNASKIALNSAGKGQITDSSTGTLFGFMSADVLTVGNNNYTTNIRGNANSAIGGKKFSDLAVKGDIPDISDFVKLSGDNTFTGTNIFSNLLSVGGSTGGTAIGMGALINVVGPEEMYTLNLPKQNGTLAIDGDYVKLTTDQTISGIKTFNAPTDVSGSETITTKFKTSNGGALIIGKEGQNSGTMLRFDQVDGTCRLRFRSSSAPGAIVWSQPEKNAVLYFDMGNSAGSGVNRVTLRNIAGTLALTKELPAAVSANPTLSGTETELTGLQIGSKKYKIPSGGGGGGGGETHIYMHDISGILDDAKELVFNIKFFSSSYNTPITVVAEFVEFFKHNQCYVTSSISGIIYDSVNLTPDNKIRISGYSIPDGKPIIGNVNFIIGDVVTTV